MAGELIYKQGPKEVYAAPLADGGRALVFFNRHINDSQYPVSRGGWVGVRLPGANPFCFLLLAPAQMVKSSAPSPPPPHMPKTKQTTKHPPTPPPCAPRDRW